MKLQEIIQILEQKAPLSLQESYDNSGLITGNKEMEITGALVCLDSIESIIEEAIRLKFNLVIAHHPIVFSGLKKINGKNYVERTIIKAIKHDIAIYAIHTNLDNVYAGVNQKICEKLGLVNTRILSSKGELKKLVTFAPSSDAAALRNAMFNAGAGRIGNYDECSFSVKGEGSFRAKPGAKPFLGTVGERHIEGEERLEFIIEAHLEQEIVAALKQHHPYEEVAYDVYALSNQYQLTGSGMIGELKESMSVKDFLFTLKSSMLTNCIRYTNNVSSKVSKVAVCGGAGSFLLPAALAENADIFITSDFKYHQFFDADNRIVIADIGHYESEQFTGEIIHDLLKEKFPTFAVRLSEINTNPVNYYL